MPVEAHSGRCTLRTGSRQFLPARSAEQLLELFIRQLGIGNCGLTRQFAASGLPGPGDLFQLLVHRRVNAADEEACDRSDAIDGAAFGNARFQTLQVRLDHLSVNLHREDQRHVNANALRD